MIGGYFNFKHINIMVVCRFMDDLFEYRSVWLNEYGMAILGSPYEMVFKAIDMV